MSHLDYTKEALRYFDDDPFKFVDIDGKQSIKRDTLAALVSLAEAVQALENHFDTCPPGDDMVLCDEYEPLQSAVSEALKVVFS
jgi:hypothetical protein